VKRILFSLCLAFQLALIPNLAMGAIGEAKEILERLEASEQKRVTLPDIEKGTLSNGLNYYILEDHELPIAQVVVFIKGGTIYDPVEKSGLTTMTASLIRNGGTETMTPQEVDEYLDDMAASIEITPDREYLVAALKCHSDHFDAVLNLFFDLLFSPRFDLERFDLIKKHFENSILRRADSPDTLSATGYRALLYGRGNSWGAYPTTESVSSITVEDIQAMHRRFFRPDQMIVGVTGDVTGGKVLSLLKEPKKVSEPLEDIKMPVASPSPKTGLHIIDKSGTQVIVNMGQLGSDRFNPDKYAIIIMNDVLGGAGFKKRLPALIRVEKGLAYSVWSSYTFGPKEVPGLFRVYLATKTESARDAVDLVDMEVERFIAGEDLTADEVARSQESILKRLIFEYESAADIVSNVVRFNYFGYPDDYIEKYGVEIGKVTLDDVKRVAKKYLNPESFQIVIVGEEAVLRKQFKDYVTVETLTIEE